MQADTKLSERRSTAVERTFLFTDVVGSTQQLERIGTQGWVDVINHHRRSISAVAGADGGTITGFTGDGFVVTFTSAAAGVASALRLQRAIWAQKKLDVRIGVASGSVMPVAMKSYVGLCMHRAARLCVACRPGEAIVEDATYCQAALAQPLPDLERRVLTVRGFSEPAHVRVSAALTGAWLR